METTKETTYASQNTSTAAATTTVPSSAVTNSERTSTSVTNKSQSMETASHNPTSSSSTPEKTTEYSSANENQTTTEIPMTSTTIFPTIPPEHVRYPVSSNYYFSDLNVNGTPTTDGSIEQVPGPFGFGTGVQLTASEKTCLRESHFYSEDDIPCFQNPSNCTSGISISIWENIKFNESDNHERYILSSGGDTEGMPGIALFHKGIVMHAVVSNGSHYWALHVLGPVPYNAWSNIGLRWKETDGLEMYVDTERVGQVVYPTANSKPPKKGIDPPEVAVGCHVVHGNPRYTNFSNGKFDELAIWMQKLNNSEIPYFLGGYDANGANMTVEKLLDIIATKLNQSDPEQYRQAVHLLSIMTQSIPDESASSPSNMEESNEDGAQPTNDTNNMNNLTSEPTTTVNNHDVPPTTPPSSSESEFRKKVEDLKTVSDIIQLMTDPTKVKKDVTTEEMANFQDLIQVVSNIFTLEKKQDWLTIQETKAGSSAVVEALQNWSMALLLETKPRARSQRSESFHYEKFTDNIVLISDKMTIEEFEDGKGLIIPNYKDPNWNNIQWNKGSSRIPLDSVALSRELFADLGRQPDSKIFISSFLFDTYDDIAPINVNEKNLPRKNIFIDSKIISMQMEPTDGLLKNFYLHPVVAMLSHNKKEATLRRLMFHNDNQTIPTTKYRYCAMWNSQIRPFGGWDAKGCEMFYSNADHTICNCEYMGTYAIIGQNIQRRELHDDPIWLVYMKYIIYSMSAVFLVFYILMILVCRQLKDQFHIIRLQMSVAALAGTACMFATDYVRGERHECTAVSAVLHYAYVAVSCWLLMESHALFSVIMYGIIGGKLKSYIPFAWGCPMIFLGISFVTGLKNYGLEPRCMVSWNDELKWTLFAPNLIFSFVAVVITITTILNNSFAAVKKESIFEDVSSVAWGLLFITITYFITWIFACLAYLDIELMSPDFYPIFQTLNASLGLMIFLFMGMGSKRFRMVFRGEELDSRHFPLLNQKGEQLIPVKPQPKHCNKPIQG